MSSHPPTLVVLGVASGPARPADKAIGSAAAAASGQALATTVRQALGARLPLLVVTHAGHEAAVADQVAGRDMVLLPLAAGRVGDAVSAAVAARPSPGGWLLLPGHMPGVQPATLQRVASALAGQSVVYAQHRGRQGHPLGFSAEMFSELVRLAGDQAPARLLARFPGHAVDVDDAEVLADG